MFRTVPLSIISSISLYTQQWYMSYSLRAGSGRNCSSVLILLASSQQNLYDIYRCCVYSEKLLNDGQRNCPKHVEFYSKNKFEKLVHLVSFIIRIYHYARSPERQNCLYIYIYIHIYIYIYIYMCVCVCVCGVVWCVCGCVCVCIPNSQFHTQMTI